MNEIIANDRRTFLCFDKNSNDLANELFKGNKFIIIKNFLDEEKINQIRNCPIDKSDNGGGVFKTSSRDKIDGKSFECQLAKKIIKLRVAISMQPSADIFMFNLARVNGLRHTDDFDLKELTDYVVSDSWFRLMKYKNGDRFDKHLDGPGEIQSILYLTEKNKDYSGGGLYISNTDESNIVCLDDFVSAGDLVFLNAYEKLHWVENICCDTNQLGRITIMIPGNPKYG